MKRFFDKATRPFAVAPDGENVPGSQPGGGAGPRVGSGSGTSAPVSSGYNAHKNMNPGSTSSAAAVMAHATLARGLRPMDVVPAFPCPCPHTHLALLATREGLLVRPHARGAAGVRVAWGRGGAVVEVEMDKAEGGGEGVDWSEAVVVYGIVGVLELFDCSYLLVITARTEVGSVLDPLRAVYGVKGVAEIPLVEDRARTALHTLAARKAALTRPSLLPRTAADSVDMDGTDDEPPVAVRASPRVQFLTPAVRFLQGTGAAGASAGMGANQDIGRSIERPPSADSVASVASDLSGSETSGGPAAPVFKTLASRLSFWNRAPGKMRAAPGVGGPAHVPVPMSLSEEQRMLERMVHEGTEPPGEVIESILASTAGAPATVEERHTELETKVVRETIREFTKGDMYFAYTFDITRSLQHKQELVLKSQKQRDLLAGLGALASPDFDQHEPLSPMDGKFSPVADPYPSLPLWRRVDKQFWWNEWLSKPFIDAGLHSYILPIMQGYCQATQFSIPTDPIAVEQETVIDYIIISRRSRHRPGLRYQRRGIDDAANVANFVETETIMRVEREQKENVFSYVQIRGSIPLFWTQTGYGLKPPPVLATDRTPLQNLDTLKRHFQKTIPVYGPHTIVNLAEQGGKEGVITQVYREYMHELNMHDAQYCEYDFHTETKGMKYENISSLIEKMERTFEAQGYFWISDNVVFSQQKGVFRVNCIDCLDRTNVVQSAFARYVMNKQLSAVALLNPNAGRMNADIAFNDVWANNGDAVSRAYAGTSALKGDFTRTGKRDLSGMLNDGVNSLARMYTATFSDWFCQAVIDFMLGNRTTSVFSEFLLKLKSTDPRDLIRLSKIRAEAIATSISRVLPEGERLLSGWTLFAPEDLNVKIGIKFEEKVLLLSAKALYIVRYDYTLEKVKLYTRVPLGDIIQIRRGAYILSPLEESSCDPNQNAGFVVTWLASRQESRVTSYSVRNSLDLTASPPQTPSSPSSPSFLSSATSRGLSRSRSNTLPALSSFLNASSFSNAGPGQQNFAAFKVLAIDPARGRRTSSGTSGMYADTSDEMHGAETCKEAVDLIVERIQNACDDVGGGQGDFVVNEDVVSVKEAQRVTSVYAKMEYGVKRLLWLGG